MGLLAAKKDDFDLAEALHLEAVIVLDRLPEVLCSAGSICCALFRKHNIKYLRCSTKPVNAACYIEGTVLTLKYLKYGTKPQVRAS